jgi:hypothetical protein
MSYQIQKQLAEAIKSVLAYGQTFVTEANIQINRDATTSTVPRYEVEIGSVAKASDQMIKITTDSVGWVNSHFTVEAEVSLITERESGVDHSAAVARTRYLFSREAQLFTEPHLSGFEVLSLTATAETQEVNADAREDATKLAFRFEVGLLASGYVTPSSG